MDTPTLQQSAEAFIRNQVSESTRKNYALVIKRFLTTKDRLQINLKGNSWTRTYINDLKLSGLKNATVNYHMTILAALYHYHTGDQLYYDRLKNEASKVEFLTKEEVDRILAAADPEFLPILMFMLDTGVRVSELERISRTDYHEVPSEFVITGKGDKQRIVVISSATKQLLRPGLIFGRIWKVHIIQRRLKKLCDEIGITKKVHPHMLRHTFATQMLWNGADITEVQKMLGHSFLQTTQIYTHVTEDRLRKTWQKFHDKARET